MFSAETIWNYLLGRIKGSSCTILLLTEDLLTCNKDKIGYIRGDFLRSGWVYNEISASLRDWKDNRINGIVCVVEDTLIQEIANNMNCARTIAESSYIDRIRTKYPLLEILELNKNYIEFINYSTFIKNPTQYVKNAVNKREEQIRTKKYRIIYDPHNR